MAALHDIVTKGSTDRSVVVHIMDAADGTDENGVVFNTAGIAMWYRREGAALTAITEATLAALTTAHADGGFLYVSDGDYRLDLPDAAFATGANYVDYGGAVTGMLVVGGRVRLIDANPETAAFGALMPTVAGRTLDVASTGEAGLDFDNILLTNGANKLGIQASGTLSGTHSATTADLGGNAPSVDISGMTLYIPVHGFSRIVDSYNTGTGVATFRTTSATLANADPWFVHASPLASTASPPPVNLTQVAGSTTDVSALATNVAAILVDTGTTLDGRIPAALVGGRIDATVDGTGMESGAINAILDAALADSVPADGALPTVRQAIYMITQFLTERSVSGTTLTIRKVDGSTSLMTFTLSDATSPVSVTRAT